MSAKLNRATSGPGWGEVFLSALLSGVLGVILGALLLVLRPVTVVKELPKDGADPRVVYYIEGSREISKSREAPAKRQAFAAGQSVTLHEEELNALAGVAGAAPGPNSGEAAKAPAPGAPVGNTDRTFSPGGPNFRLHDGTLQVGFPVTVNLLGLSRPIVVQARGGFVKQRDLFVYEPAEMYLGSCPLERLPFVASYVRAKFVNADAIPEDTKASWAKLAQVSIENNALKLTMP